MAKVARQAGASQARFVTPLKARTSGSFLATEASRPAPVVLGRPGFRRLSVPKHPSCGEGLLEHQLWRLGRGAGASCDAPSNVREVADKSGSGVASPVAASEWTERCAAGQFDAMIDIDQ